MAAARQHQHQDRNGPDLAAAHTTSAAARQPQSPGRDEPGQHRVAALNGHRKERLSGGHGRTDRTSGSGLGLSIVQAIANAHGGRATLESWPGQGTKVRVWLRVRIVP